MPSVNFCGPQVSGALSKPRSTRPHQNALGVGTKESIAVVEGFQLVLKLDEDPADLLNFFFITGWAKTRFRERVPFADGGLQAVCQVT